MTTRAWIAAAFVLIAVGCGGGKATVKGKVTSGGKPVVWGSVILVDASGAYHQGDIELNGTYEIAGVPNGTVKIGVTSPSPVDQRGGGRPGGGKEAPKGGGGFDDPREKLEKMAARPTPPAGAWFQLPNQEKNSDPTQSGMTGEVKSGQPLDIDIK